MLKNENEHSWFKMYGIKFGPNVSHLSRVLLIVSVTTSAFVTEILEKNSQIVFSRPGKTNEDIKFLEKSWNYE